MKIYCDGSNTLYCFQVDGEPAHIFTNPLWATHNESEYLAIIAALFWCARYRDKIHVEVKIVSDSQWAIRQILGEYKVKERRFLLPCHIAQQMIENCGVKVGLSWVSREENKAGTVLEEIKKGGANARATNP